MTYGVVPTGFSRKPLGVVLSEIEAGNITVFGPDVIQTSQSPLGQLNGLAAELIAILWEFAEDVYQSYDPDQAEGVRLDTLARLRILSRGIGEDDLSLRQAITNQGRARIDIQDIIRAVRAADGVTWSHVFVNDGDADDENGLDCHSVAVAAIGGDDHDIASIARAYVVPGIGTSGNVRVDTTVDGVCRSIWIIRPVPVPISLEIKVDRRHDKMGCPPTDLLSIKKWLIEYLNGQNRFINGEDVTVYSIRAAIECQFPNVEVASVSGSRDGVTGMPIEIGFFEIAEFLIENVMVENAT